MGELSQGILIFFGQTQSVSSGQNPTTSHQFNNELIALASIFISTIPLIIAQFVKLNQDTVKSAAVNNKLRLDEVSLQSQQKDQKISDIESRLLVANETINALKEQVVDLKSQISNRNMLFTHIATIIQISLREDDLDQIKNQLNSIIALIDQNQPK